MVLGFRVAAIVIGVALFALAELRDVANERKPAATGRERYKTFYDDATVFGLRIAGLGLAVLALVSWVIGNHMPPR